MQSAQTRIGPLAVLAASVAYVLIGVGTAILAQAGAPIFGVKGWRLAAWLLSFAVFIVHVVFARQHGAVPRNAAAFQVALAVALGAFGVAALGPVRSHWTDPNIGRVALLSLVVWPVLTGLPAFVAALIGEYILTHGARTSRSSSHL